jgi:tetratricopeptide (TPR) repeat protein
MRTLLLLAPAALLATSSPATFADSPLTHDGRHIQVEKAREIEGGYRLEFRHGVIECPAEFVQSVEIEGDMSDYVPQNDDEARKLEKGFVRYRGKWMTKVAYENQLKKEQEESAERTEELAAHSQWHEAWEKETKHFLFKSNTTPELLDYYADLLESYYDLIDDQIRIKPSPKYRRTKMKVRIYKSQNDFLELSPPIGSSGTLGYFTWYDDSLNFYHDFQEPALSNWVALHECTHLLTFLIDQEFDSPAWLNEGVADYLGSSSIEVDKKGRFKIEPGQVQIDRILTVQEAMRSGTDTKLKDMIRMHSYADGFGGFEYAHAWSFIYFLNNSKGDYKKGFDKLFKDVYTIHKSLDYTPVSGGARGASKMIAKDDWEGLLLSYLKADSISQLEKEWKEFVDGIEVDGPVARFKRGQRAVMWGDAFSDDDEEKRAMDDLNAAIAGGVEDPRAYYARGRLNDWNGRRSQAIADYEKAVELSPMNASFRYSLGQELSGYEGLFSSFGAFRIRISGNRSLAGEEIDADRQDAEEAWRHFGLAVELDPQNAGYQIFYDDYVEAFEKKFGEVPAVASAGE